MAVSYTLPLDVTVRIQMPGQSETVQAIARRLFNFQIPSVDHEAFTLAGQVQLEPGSPYYPLWSVGGELVIPWTGTEDYSIALACDDVQAVDPEAIEISPEEARRRRLPGSEGEALSRTPMESLPGEIVDSDAERIGTVYQRMCERMLVAPDGVLYIKVEAPRWYLRVFRNDLVGGGARLSVKPYLLQRTVADRLEDDDPNFWQFLGETFPAADFVAVSRAMSEEVQSLRRDYEETRQPNGRVTEHWPEAPDETISVFLPEVFERR